MQKIHRFLLNYLPLAGYAAWGLSVGFEDELFKPIWLSGWIVMVVYQTIISAIYSPPRYISAAIASLLLTPVILFVNSYWAGNDFTIIFIETTAIGLMSCIAALIIAFIMKAIKEGLPAEMRFPVGFTIVLFATVAFFIGRLFYRFFESQEFDMINIAVVVFGLCSTSWYFINRMSLLTNRFSKQVDVKQNKEFSARGVLITVAVWIVLVPLAMWIKAIIVQ